MIINILSIVSSLFVSGNLLFWQVDLLGFIYGLIYLLSLVISLSRAIDWVESKGEKIIWSILIISGLTVIVGSVFFYTIGFDQAVSIAWMVILAILVAWLTKNKNSVNTIKNYFILRSTLFIVSILTLVLYLLLNQINDAVRTPWNILLPNALVLYALVTLSFIYLAKKSVNIWWLVLLALASWSLLNLSFPLTFGFDPWIHQATEKILLTQGTISPQPFYYIGQYTLVTWLTHLTNLTVETVDKWLVVVLGALAWAGSFFAMAKKIIPDKRWLLPVASASLISAWPIFTITNPTNLALLWSVITIALLATKKENHTPWWVIIITTLSSLVTHPLIGLPLAISVVIFWYWEKSQVKKTIKILSLLTLLLSTPLSFIFISYFGKVGMSVNLVNNFLPGLEQIGRSITNPFIWHPYLNPTDLTYLVANWLPCLFILLGAWGLKQTKNIEPTWQIFGILFSVTALSFVLMKLFFTWPSLPANEQDFYTNRLWQLSLLFLWPLVIIGLSQIWQKVSAGGPGNQAKLQIFLGLGLIIGFYITYPRHDNYHKDTGYNTTSSDIEAVNLIASDAGPAPYAVLANQAVAAAAIHEYGFSHYYQGNFYYPIPTSSNDLYPIFLEAVESNGPYYEVVKKAHQRLNINTIYLIINNYWADAERLNTIANEESNKHLYTSDNKISIFRYNY